MKKTTAFAAALLLTLVAAAATPAPADFHFNLRASSPEADSEVASPEEVRLWFTQVPQENTMSVRLIAGEEALETGDLAQDAEDGKIFALPIEGTLPAGQYTVAWRAIGQDGHPVRGDFAFTVTAQRP